LAAVGAFLSTAVSFLGGRTKGRLYFREMEERIMEVRSINKSELERFIQQSDHPHPENIARDKEFIQELWAKSLSRPEWFFLAEIKGEAVGRVAYWRLKARQEELRMIFFKLPWERDYLDVGLQLLLESWEKLRATDARYVVRQLSSAWDYLDEQREVFEHAGMSLLQEKHAYLWRPTEPVTVPERLIYRTLAQVGESAYVQAIRQVTTGTLDREIQAMGGAKAARQLFVILKEDTFFEPEWLQLAYDSEGELIGLVAPVRMLDNEEEGSIGYIGVVPEKRGRGYIHDLLAKGMAISQSVGVLMVYSEVDSENNPIRWAFERAGHETAGFVWLYRGTL
jgi:RimJ/RimL family protein N-acetyltransferase